VVHGVTPDYYIPYAEMRVVNVVLQVVSDHLQGIPDPFIEFLKISANYNIF
jgi:hypothetical protein